MPSSFGASTVISGVSFGSTIHRLAAGSDNWPMTWAGDGDLYTAYGDGWGFESIGSGTKWALATAKVTGSPTTHSGTDLGTIAAVGGGGTGPEKASGLMSLGGGLIYMWQRPDAQLWKSTDYSANWAATSVEMRVVNDHGYCGFVQHGQDNAGAPGGYVYAYATDDDPFALADNIWLFRVLAANIEDDAQYEYVTNLSNPENPTWGTRANRIAVFADTGKIYRPRIAYNAGLDRYILTTRLATEPAIAIYDAPHPWGPWTTMYYDDNWGQGFVFELEFPTKWIGADGTHLWMVFSGVTTNDAFCVREVTLSLFEIGGGGGGSGVAGPFPITEIFPVTAGSVWGGWHQGAGSGSKEDAGIQVLTGLASDATVSFRKVIPDTLPNGTPYLVLHALGNVASGIARVEVFWSLVNPLGTLSSVVNAAYRWIASAAGTNEYYVELAAGGDPSLASPNVVYLNGDPEEKGTLGSLAAGTWGYGNNDTLGFSTIYVRLADGTDPDSKAADFVQALVDVGGDPSSTALNSEGIFEVEWTTGDADNYLEILIPLNAISWAARRLMVGQLVFKGQAGWPAVTTTWKPYLEWK